MLLSFFSAKPFQWVLMMLIQGYGLFYSSSSKRTMLISVYAHIQSEDWSHPSPVPWIYFNFSLLTITNPKEMIWATLEPLCSNERKKGSLPFHPHSGSLSRRRMCLLPMSKSHSSWSHCTHPNICSGALSPSLPLN
jgi:hypothetical protein